MNIRGKTRDEVNKLSLDFRLSLRITCAVFSLLNRTLVRFLFGVCGARAGENTATKLGCGPNQPVWEHLTEVQFDFSEKVIRF